jgi:acetyltransferase-like isoleucine patch superfamily enzyme
LTTPSLNAEDLLGEFNGAARPDVRTADHAGIEEMRRHTSPGTDETGPRPGVAAGVRLFVIHLVNYLTNHVISHIPSFGVRKWWYGRILGIKMGQQAVVHMGCFMWSYTPRHVRNNGIEFGDHSYINRGCCIDIRGPLTIGKNVSISPEVMILTAAHDANDPSFPVHHRPVVIDDYVWIGSRAVILPGVTLGRGCVVAAGAVVSRDVQPLEIVAGVPARPVGVREESATVYVLDGQPPLFE